MRILGRYLVREILLSILVVLAIFLSLFVLFDFIQRISSATYLEAGIWKLIAEVVLTMPSFAYELAPLSALTGTLLALAKFASQSEYVVIRSSGVSLVRMSSILLIVSFVFSSGTFVVGEIIAPYSDKVLKRVEQIKPSGEAIAQTFRSGHWIKDRERIFNIKVLNEDFDMSGITIFEINLSDRSIRRILRADSGRITENGTWTFSDIEMTEISNTGIHRSNINSIEFDTTITTEILSSLVSRESKLSIWDLNRYINHLKNNGEDYYSYESAHWSRIGHLMTVFLLVLVAPTFISVENRQRHVGFWVFIGVVSGVALYFLNQLIKSIGTINRWPPEIHTFLPVLLILLASYAYIYRQERR